MNDNNENIVLDETDWSKLTFLTKKDEKEEAKEKTKGVKIAFLTLLSFSALSVLALLILTFVFASKGNPNFTASRGYGILGLVGFILFLLSIALSSVLQYFMDTVWFKKENKQFFSALTGASYYLAIALLYSSFALIPLRKAVLDISEVFSYWNIILLALVWIVCIVFMALGFIKDEKTNKTIFSVSSILLPAIILCFSSILVENYSLSGFAIPLLVASVVSSIIALPLLNNKKSDSALVASRFFTFASFLMDAIAILYYGMIVASNLY